MATRSKRKNKPRSKRPKKSFTLGAISIPASKTPAQMTRYDIMGIAGSFVAGAILSQAIGNNLIGAGSGLALVGGGVYKKNIYLSALGVGMIITTPPSAVTQNMNGLPEDEVNGLNLKNFASGARLRVGSFFSSFKEKFKLPKKAVEQPSSEETTNGMGNVYKSPFRLQEPNMAELDKLERQIEEMNGLFGEEMPNREF